MHCGSEGRVCMFPGSNKLSHAKKEVLAIWVHSNSSIKNLTSFEDDAKIHWLSFQM